MEKYSILLPTYNEKDNLPIIIWLIVQQMEKRFEVSNSILRTVKFISFLPTVVTFSKS